MASINLDISTKLDITCRRNDTFSLELTFADDTGAPVNLEEYSNFMMEVRRHDRQTGNAIVKFTKADGQISGNSFGEMLISRDAASMSISGGDYVYDMQAVKSSGEVYTWLRGRFKVNEDVTI